MFLLSELRGPSKTNKNPKGWTIGAIKTALDKKTKQYSSILFKSSHVSYIATDTASEGIEFPIIFLSG